MPSELEGLPCPEYHPTEKRVVVEGGGGEGE
jgi:hypothetical protein